MQENIKPMQENITTLKTPIYTKDRFSEKSGLRIGQIRGQIQAGNLEFIKFGRLCLVNLLQHAPDAQPACSIMTPQKFALETGLKDSQVITQIDEKNLPVRYVGRLRMIDMVEIFAICRQALAEA